jgi:hypothetical protein
MLMLGVQKVSPVYRLKSPLLTASWCLALASSDTIPKVSSTAWSSKVAANPMACGNTVAFPALATPCRASFHQSYLGIPNRSLAGESFIIREIFSSVVNRDNKSSALAAAGREGFFQGSICPFAIKTEHVIKTDSKIFFPGSIILFILLNIIMVQIVSGLNLRQLMKKTKEILSTLLQNDFLRN